MLQEERRQIQRRTWELFKSTSMVEAVRKARDLGWEDKKVQVRVMQRAEGDEYYVEPFEKDCGCRNILKFSDFFDPSPKTLEDVV